EVDQGDYNKRLLDKASEEAEARPLDLAERQEYVEENLKKEVLDNEVITKNQKILSKEDTLTFEQKEESERIIKEEKEKIIERLNKEADEIVKPKGKLSEKTKKELLHKLRINVLDSKGRRVQMLKGIRNEGEVKDNLRGKFITLREE